MRRGIGNLEGRAREVSWMGEGECSVSAISTINLLIISDTNC